MSIEEYEKQVSDFLASKNLFPFSVVFTYNGGVTSGMLGMTFYIREDVDELLCLLGYEKICDKSGFTIIRETNTVILSEMALDKFISTMGRK